MPLRRLRSPNTAEKSLFGVLILNFDPRIGKSLCAVHAAVTESHPFYSWPPQRSSLRLPGLHPNGTSSSLGKPPEAHFVKPTTTLATDARRVNNAYSPVFGLHHHHHHHTRHRTPGGQASGGYLAPEKVIEQIFNPTFSTFTGPFYKPYPRGVTAADENAHEDDVESTTSMPSPDQAGSTHSLGKNPTAASDDGGGTMEGMQVSVKTGHRLTNKIRHVMRVS